MTGARPVHDDDFGDLDMEPPDDDDRTGFEHPCPRCHGTGQDEFAPCGRCNGEGYLDD